MSIRGLVAFDLDGTLLRGDTVCEVLAKPLGRTEEMKRFESVTTEAEMVACREQMAKWFNGLSNDALCSYLGSASWAPGAHDAVQRLQDANVTVVVASITWKFAVQWFAEQLNVKDCLGTDITQSGELIHVWGRDKGKWLGETASRYGVPQERIAAVGDSAGDLELLSTATLRFYVGAGPTPELASLVHLPEADLRVVADRILAEWD